MGEGKKRGQEEEIVDGGRDRDSATSESEEKTPHEEERQGQRQRTKEHQCVGVEESALLPRGKRMFEEKV